MSSDNQEKIKNRAYEIWDRHGRLDGQHEEHWAQARREIEAEEGAARSGSGGRITTADDPTRGSAGSGGASGFSGAQSGGSGGGLGGVSSGFQRGGTEPAGGAPSGSSGAGDVRKP